MPQHEVRMMVPNSTQVTNSDVTFTVTADGSKLGELQISKGTIDWKPAGKQGRASLPWETFDKWMRDYGEF